MRKVLKSSAEVAHYWANQVQSEGKAGNIFFEGSEIYSYGHHFCLGSIQTSEKTGESLFFLNTNKYSTSTAKHQNHVAQSIPQWAECFSLPFNRCHYFNLNTLQETVQKLIILAEFSISKQLKARENSYYILDAVKYLEDAIEIKNHFPTRCDAIEAIKLLNGEELKAAKAKAAYIKATKVEREKKAEERKAVKERENLAAWLKHEYNGYFYSIPVALRLSKDYTHIQTTKGASVPTEQALNTWARIVKGENVIGERLGHYRIDEVTDQHITVGCHMIELDTIKSFVKSLRVLRAAIKIQEGEKVC